MLDDLVARHRPVQDLVARFVDDELMPLEPAILERHARGVDLVLTADEQEPLLRRAHELGLWGLDAPADLGGYDLPALAMIGVLEELGRSVIPFVFPPDSPVLHMLKSVASPEQRLRYLEPYVRGEMRSATAISEPDAGADPADMRTRARRDGDGWVINGRKIWVSRLPQADFTILIARVDDPGVNRVKLRHAGITAFIVERGTPGFNIAREIPMLAGHHTYEIQLENCRLPANALLGTIGKGFAPMQLRLTVRRVLMGATCLGMARRALDIMTRHVSMRSTFGTRLSERQAIQWWIADAAIAMHACRMMVIDAAAKQGAGQDVRTEASMIKVHATEMAGRIIDQAMQALGAIGMTRETPLQLLAEKVRIMRIYEGPTEVHRMNIARRMLATHK
jgi:alkylation response protein AidB-like acyl-CoA dehydrogenase